MYKKTRCTYQSITFLSTAQQTTIVSVTDSNIENIKTIGSVTKVHTSNTCVLITPLKYQTKS